MKPTLRLARGRLGLGAWETNTPCGGRLPVLLSVLLDLPDQSALFVFRRNTPLPPSAAPGNSGLTSTPASHPRPQRHSHGRKEERKGTREERGAEKMKKRRQGVLKTRKSRVWGPLTHTWSRQWAAVSTHSGDIRVPPQKCLDQLKKRILVKSDDLILQKSKVVLTLLGGH